MYTLDLISALHGDPIVFGTKKILIACVFALPFDDQPVRAQSLSASVIGSTGGHFASSGGSLSWTLGEIMTETYKQNRGFLTQGFHQPLMIRVTGLEEVEEKNLLVFPNPVRDILNLQITENGDYRIELFDLQGQRLVNDQTQMATGKKKKK